jgi:hypothetical protein
VRVRRDARPAVQIDAEKDGLGEERESFEGEERAYQRPGPFHERGPQEPQLERQDRSGDGANREKNGGALRPSLRERQIAVVAGPHPAPFGDRHQRGHGDAQRGEHDVEGQGHGHLRARGEKIGHRKGKR